MRYLLPALAFLLLPLGCTPAGSDEATDDDWNLVEDGLRLEEELFLAETADFFFGSIADLDVAGDGRIYVADREEHHVKVLSPEGKLLHTIGREGEGPGEFQRLQQVVLARGDSVFAYESGRIKAFGPNPEYPASYTVSLERDGNSTPSGTLLVPGDGGFFLPYVTIARGVEDEDRIQALRAIGPDGTPGDTLFAGKPRSFVTDDSGDIPISAPLRYGRQSFFTLGPDDQIYHASTDSLSAVSVTREGAHSPVFSVPTEPVPITRADRDEATGTMPDGLRRIMLDAMPETKPDFDHFLVDDQHRFWFKRTSDDSDRAEWWVVQPEEGRIVTASLPSEVDLEVVKNGYAYGQTHDEMGAPALVRYRVVE